MEMEGSKISEVLNVLVLNEDYKYYNNSTLLFEGYLKSSFGGRYLEILTFTNASQYSEVNSTQLIGDATYSFYPQNVELIMDLNDKLSLHENYTIVPVDIQISYESLWLRLYKDDEMVDEVILLDGQNYSYYSADQEIISTKLAAIFAGMNTDFIKFEDFYQYSELNGSMLKYYDDLLLRLGHFIPPSAPVASDQSVATPENTIVDITLSATDVNGDSLTYSIVDDPSHGNVTLSGNIATYTPDMNYNGSDNFTFKANDSTVDSNTATVSITISAVNNAPVADFTGTPISGPEPLTVVFTDSSTPNDGITACAWDFNNNGTVDSTEQNPTHVYTQSGTYTVTLTVYEADGDSHTETKTDYIKVTTPPDTTVPSIYVNETGWWRNSSEFNASNIPIQHAINNATTTDVIYVYNGSYTENVNVDEQLTLIGEGTDVVTVTAAVSNDHVFEVTADDVNISGFTVTGATDSHMAGIYLDKVNHCHIFNNNASNNDRGIYLDKSEDNTLIVNTATSNNGCGIYLDKSKDNTLTDNTATSNNHSGIYLDKSNDNMLTDNNVTSNNYSGIYLDKSNDNTLTDNNVTSNNHSGICLDGSNDNALTDNTATSNNHSGIYLDGSNDNTLTDNTVTSNNHSGIYLYGSNDNNQSGNTVTSNNNWGIYLNGSKENIIYNNYFDNTNNACDDNNANDKKGKNNNNIWNDTKTTGQNIIGGSYIGGNYWSDYAGVDSNGDGLGDTLIPYNSSGNITNGGDYLPLVTEASVPTVTGNTPTGTNVPVTNVITVTFDESMNTTLVEDAFSINDSSVTGTFSWAGYTMTFTPSAELAYSTTYEVTIGTQAEDLAGNPLAAAYIWDFTTGPEPDSTPTTDGGRDHARISGGRASGEAFENIAVKEKVRKYIAKGTTVTFQFKEDANSIEFIKFDGKTNAGYVIATVETLKDESTLVSSTPSGQVYQYMNIFVGDDYATDKNIANAVIRIKVAKSWIAENDIDGSTIMLHRYNKGKWNQLVTKWVHEDAKYLYLEAETPGFSPFAITGKTMGESGGKDIIAGSTVTAEKTPIPTEKKGIPGFSLFAGLSVLLIAVQLLRKKN